MRARTAGLGRIPNRPSITPPLRCELHDFHGPSLRARGRGFIGPEMEILEPPARQLPDGAASTWGWMDRIHPGAEVNTPGGRVQFVQ